MCDADTKVAVRIEITIPSNAVEGSSSDTIFTRHFEFAVVDLSPSDLVRRLNAQMEKVLTPFTQFVNTVDAVNDISKVRSKLDHASRAHKRTRARYPTSWRAAIRPIDGPRPNSLALLGLLRCYKGGFCGSQSVLTLPTRNIRNRWNRTSVTAIDSDR